MSLKLQCLTCGSKSGCTCAEDRRKVFCFRCRSDQHRVSDCPEQKVAAVDDVSGGDKKKAKKKKSTKQRIKCYNCGHLGHNTKACRIPLIADGLSFADCFICNSVGHLATKCPQKKEQNSIYPAGGCCHKCNSVEHLSKDCTLGKSSSASKSEKKKKAKSSSSTPTQKYTIDGGSSASAPADIEACDIDSLEPDFAVVMPLERKKNRHAKRRASDNVKGKSGKKRKW